MVPARTIGLHTCVLTLGWLHPHLPVDAWGRSLLMYPGQLSRSLPQYGVLLVPLHHCRLQHCRVHAGVPRALPPTGRTTCEHACCICDGLCVRGLPAQSIKMRVCACRERLKIAAATRQQHRHILAGCCVSLIRLVDQKHWQSGIHLREVALIRQWLIPHSCQQHARHSRFGCACVASSGQLSQRFTARHTACQVQPCQ